MSTTSSPPPPPPASPSPQPPPPPPGGGPDGGPRVSREEVRDLGRLRRVREGRNVAGVAGGIARHLDIDVNVVIVLFVVLSFFGGAGLVLYAVCWLLVPEEGTERAVVSLDDRTRTVALVVGGALAVLALVGDSVDGRGGIGFGLGFLWPPLLVVAAIVVVVVLVRGSTRPHPLAPRPGPGQPTAWTPGTPGGAAHVSAPPAPAPPRPRPRDPRRRGPLLFWFTLALAALGVGVVLTLDLAGLDVPGSAYPATVLAVCGVMLLVGAFFGRAGGLTLVGLLAALATLAATLGAEVDGGREVRTPGTAAEVASVYQLDAGEIVLDLTDVRDLDRLDGRTVRLDVDLGRVEVRVPPDLSVVVDGEIRGDGQSTVFGSGDAGDDVTGVQDAGPAAPELRLEPSVDYGEVVVVTAGSPTQRLETPRRSTR